jgi:membrane-bound inhibitor of C-type lysozyme
MSLMGWLRGKIGLEDRRRKLRLEGHGSKHEVLNGTLASRVEGRPAASGECMSVPLSNAPLTHALLLTGLLALSACSDPKAPASTAGSPPSPATAAPGTGAEVLVYHCADGETVRASYPTSDTAVVEFAGRSRTLKTAASASGARYVGDGLQWWTKGLTEGVVSPLAAGEDVASASGTNCAVAPPPAPTPTQAAAPPPVVTSAAPVPTPLPAEPPPRPKPGEELIEPSRDLGGVLPLKHGIFVASDATCQNPPNAAIRRYDGQGLSGAHTRACRAKVLSKKGAAYEVEQSCLDAGAGPAPRSSERQTIVVANNLEFTLRRAAGEQTFKYCAASLLPPGVR